jgi:hypothetical protein
VGSRGTRVGRGATAVESFTVHSVLAAASILCTSSRTACAPHATRLSGFQA